MTHNTKRKPAKDDRLPSATEFSRSPDPMLRKRALEMAARLGAPGAELIWTGLVDPEPLVRETAIRFGAARLPGPRLLRGVASEGNSVLRTACIEVLKLKGTAALPALRKGLGSQDHDVILFTLQILGSLPEPEAVPLLMPFLTHEDVNIAQAAIDGLGELKARRAVGPLLGLLGGDLWLRLAAVIALGKIGDPRATLDLLGVIDDETLGTTALEAIGRIADPGAVKRLTAALVSEDRIPQRDEILTALGECLKPSGLSGLRSEGEVLSERFLSYLQEALASPRDPLKAAANRFVRAFQLRPLYTLLVEHLDEEPLTQETVSFLAALPADQGEAIVRAALTHDRPGVRAAALRVLGLRSEPWGDPLLVERLADPDAEVLAATVRSLARRRPPNVFSRVLPLLFHVSEAVRTRALEALPALAAPGDVDQVRSLLQSATDPEEQIIYVELSRRLDRDRFVGVWLDLLHGAPGELLRVLLRALGEVTTPEIRPRLLPFLDHPAHAIRTLAIESLAHGSSSEELGPELHRRLLTDPDCTYYLIRALGRIRYRPASGDLENLYERAAPLEKIAVLEALGAMETPAAARFLKTELESKDRERRRASATALARHFHKGNFALFSHLAKSDDWALRNTAAWALGETHRTDARPILRRLTDDPEDVVARTARSALEKLGAA
jgi:HEAT repeat protein